MFRNIILFANYLCLYLDRMETNPPPTKHLNNEDTDNILLLNAVEDTDGNVEDVHDVILDGNSPFIERTSQVYITVPCSVWQV